VRKLFEVEVPEISEGHIRVMRVARDPGYRCKVAVYPMEQRIDAVGACLGVRGTRIRNINDEVGQEKIDIIQWSDSLEELVQNALKPAKGIEVDHIFPDVENQSVFVLVAEDQKPLAIGVGGRNVRLAARIVGWDIEIKTPTEYEAEMLAAEGEPEVQPEGSDAIPADDVEETEPGPTQTEEE
jgi:N utilization substance protein A